MNITINISKDEDGKVIVDCPNYKGCHSAGDTLSVALANFGEVLEMCIEETITV